VIAGNHIEENTRSCASVIIHIELSFLPVHSAMHISAGGSVFTTSDGHDSHAEHKLPAIRNIVEKRKKLRRVKYIALSAILPSGLN